MFGTMHDILCRHICTDNHPVSSYQTDSHQQLFNQLFRTRISIRTLQICLSLQRLLAAFLDSFPVVPTTLLRLAMCSSILDSISPTVTVAPILALSKYVFPSCRGLPCVNVVLVAATCISFGLTGWSHSRTSPVAPVFEAGHTSPCDTYRSLDSPCSHNSGGVFSP